MSNSDSEVSVVSGKAAIARLEKAVASALTEIVRLRDEVTRLGDQGEELEGLLAGVTSGERSVREVLDRLHILEDENRDLRARLDQGRDGVERILARIKFLEEHR